MSDEGDPRDSVYSVYSISSGSSNSDQASLKSPISPIDTPSSAVTPVSASSSNSGRSKLSSITSSQSPLSASSGVSGSKSSDEESMVNSPTLISPTSARSELSPSTVSDISLASSASSRRKRRKGKNKAVTFGANEVKEMTPVEEGLSTATSLGSRSTISTTSSGGLVSPTGSGSPLSSPVPPGSRTQAQDILRIASLYAFPALLTVPLGLILHLITLLLTPLFNSTPLRLHITLLYVLYGITSATIYGSATLHSPAQEIISARVCLTTVAIAGDLIIVMGRRVGGTASAWAGAEYGALLARLALGLGVISGANAFALLCFDHVIPLEPAIDTPGRLVNIANVAMRTGGYIMHIYYAEKAWAYLLDGSVSFLVQHPEKTILFVSLLLTLLSLFVRAPRTTGSSFAQTTHHLLSTTFGLSGKSAAQLQDVTGFLPRTVSPVLFLLRLPLLILAVRQHIFLRPSPPYLAANRTLRVLHSERSVTGQIVVADNLAAGYRYLRCDSSLLGGRWMRISENGTRVDLGDSIFAAFALQEIGVLAVKNGEEDTLAKTISMTTELQLTNEQEDDEDDKPQNRALIIGLGVGISAMGLARRGYAVDIVEIDPLIARLAQEYFNHTMLSDSSTLSILPGQDYIEQISAIDQNMNHTMQKWSYVIHDCFSAGQLPYQVYTREFWDQMVSLVEVDGIVAINVAGVLGSLAVRRIVATLLSVFTQCRAFQELGEESRIEGLSNMVILCTMAHSPLLTFRPPTRFDVLRSPLRSHMFSTFHDKETQLDSLLNDQEMEDPEMVISVNGSMAGLDQISTSLETWKAMQSILTRDMWLAW